MSLTGLKLAHGSVQAILAGLLLRTPPGIGFVLIRRLLKYAFPHQRCSLSLSLCIHIKKQSRGILKKIDGTLKEINGILEGINGILEQINATLKEINIMLERNQ